MEQFFISDEQYSFLKSLAHGEIDSIDDDAIGKYLKDNGLVDLHLDDYRYSPGDGILAGYYVPTRRFYTVTEFGKGYIAAYEQRRFEFESLRHIADAAKDQADIARKDSKGSTIRSWIAIVLSALAILSQVLSSLGIIHVIQ